MAIRLRSALGAGFILLMCSLCVRLGFWQLDRLEQRRARNAVIARGLSAPPAPLTPAALAGIDRDPAAWTYRRITATGEYRPAGEVLLRGRSDHGRPGVHVVTPLASGGRILLVNRGWIPAPDGVRPEVRVPPPAGPVHVEGILMEIPRTENQGQPASPGGVRTFRRLDRRVMREEHGDALIPLYLQASAGDSLPRAVALPELDEGPHLGYAVQWFSFAAIGLIGLVVLARRRSA